MYLFNVCILGKIIFIEGISCLDHYANVVYCLFEHICYQQESEITESITVNVLTCWEIVRFSNSFKIT